MPGYPRCAASGIGHVERMVLSMFDDTEPGVTLKLDEGTFPKVEPGTQISFDKGVPKTFTASPFMITMEVEKANITGLPKAAAPAHHPPAHRPAAGRRASLSELLIDLERTGFALYALCVFGGSRAWEPRLTVSIGGIRGATYVDCPAPAPGVQKSPTIIASLRACQCSLG